MTLSSLLKALPEALAKLDPRHVFRSPVIFVVWVGSILTTALAVTDPSVFTISVTIWLWLTVLFANMAEAVAEGRGKAQAASLRATRTETIARRLTKTGAEEQVPGTALRVGDRVVVQAGEVIPGDGDVIDGVATVDESAITGESAPVIRESGGDRSAVTGGTTVLSDRIVVQITTKPGESFIDRMIALVEGAERQKTPNEIALTILLTTLTIVFLVTVMALQPFASYSGKEQPVVVLVALLVCLIPTTIGALLSAIGIAGMDRLVQRNVLAMSGRAVEAAGDVSTLLLDKTGTITLGNRRATEFCALPGTRTLEVARASYAASLADRTPEGKSIVELATVNHGVEDLTSEANLESAGAEFVKFTAQTRMSGVDYPSGTQIRKGAASAVTAWVREGGGTIPAGTTDIVDGIAGEGATPLVVAERVGSAPAKVLGVIRLKDVVKPGMVERFDTLRAMGIRTVMITGDNKLTAQAIAREAGVDDFLAEATPEDKMRLIGEEQAGGRLVAMTGDGTNDAPALAKADVGVAMNTGTAAAKEAGNMVDLDSDPTKLIEIVAIGKQLLITRGALTTFSIANDVAKYFAIIPAMFVGVFPGLKALNIMDLHSPLSAMLSAVIFNALVIIALIPLALRGVRYTPSGAAAMLRRNLLIYGLGGIIAPFVGIKLIDLVVSLLPRNELNHMSLTRQSLAALRMLIVMTVLLGIGYPAVVWGVGRVAFHGQAAGSIVRVDGKVVGSSLLGQDFTAADVFHSRPSASNYSGDTSGGSNLAASDPAQVKAIADRKAALVKDGDLPADGVAAPDALTASASGLDPDISPAYAMDQVPRVARATGLSEAVVTKLVTEHTSGRVLGFLGEERVNVLALNLALAAARN